MNTNKKHLSFLSNRKIIGFSQYTKKKDSFSKDKMIKY